MINTTTIEGWEKDKAATLKHNGKIQEVGYYGSDCSAAAYFAVRSSFHTYVPRVTG